MKLLLILAMCLISIMGCEKERQAPVEVAAKPKQIMDKVSNDINNASAIATENLKAAEDESGLRDQPEK